MIDIAEKNFKDNNGMLLSCKTTEIQIFSLTSFATIWQVPMVLASPGQGVASAFEGFAISITYD